MAHNARIRADLAAWGAAIPVEPEEFNYLDEGVYNSINGDGGGTWTPAAAIIVGGSGIHLSGANHQILSGGFLTVANGGTIALHDGAELDVDAEGVGVRYLIDCRRGGSIRLLGSVGAICDLHLDQYATLTMTSDASATVAGNFNIASGGNLVVQANGAIDVQADADINVVADGDINVQTDGAINIQANGAINVASAGNINIQSGGDIDVQSGGDINLESGAEIIAATGSNIRMRGLLEIGDASNAGQMLVTGAAGYTRGYLNFAGADCFSFGSTATGAIQGILRREAAGRITERVIAGSTGSATYAPSDADVVIAEAGVGSGASTYTLSSAGAVHGDKIRFICFDQNRTITVASANTIYSSAEVGATVVLKDDGAAGAVRAATFIWSDGAGGHPAQGWYLDSYDLNV